MLKKEWIYRELLTGFFEGKKRVFTQLALAGTLGVSLSTVHHALRPLAAMGAISIRARGLRITDAHKVLLYWASLRQLDREVVYRTRVEQGPLKIEASLPPGVILTAYSAYRRRFGESPADYSEVYVYAGAAEVEELKRRFPARKGPANLFILEADAALVSLSRQEVAPLPQVFVDLWSLREWYARDFLRSLEDRLELRS